MKQVIQSRRTGRLALKNVPAPQVKPGHVLVRTRASLISAGTERMVVEFAKKSLASKARARPDLVKKVVDKAKRDGLARNIGVSNFTIPLLDEAMAKCPEPLVTNQIEYHTYINQDRLIAACRKHGLLITCHAPLARGAMLDDPVILDIAAAHNKTAAQVALRWLIQQPDVGIVPRALEFSEIEENIGIYEFTLSDADMDRIGQLKARNLRVIDPEVRRPVWDEEISG